MQIILNESEIETIYEALHTDITALQEEKDFAKSCGKDITLYEKKLSRVKMLIKRLRRQND